MPRNSTKFQTEILPPRKQKKKTQLADPSPPAASLRFNSRKQKKMLESRAQTA